MTSMKTFKQLCKEFIEAEKKITCKDDYAEKDDLSYLYRFISRNGWRQLEEWRRRKLI